MGESIFSINFNLVNVYIDIIHTKIIMTDPIHGLKMNKLKLKIWANPFPGFSISIIQLARWQTMAKLLIRLPKMH